MNRACQEDRRHSFRATGIHKRTTEPPPACILCGKVFILHPVGTLVGMPASSPAPETYPNLIVYGYEDPPACPVAVVIGPPPDTRIYSRHQHRSRNTMTSPDDP